MKSRQQHDENEGNENKHDQFRKMGPKVSKKVDHFFMPQVKKNRASGHSQSNDTNNILPIEQQISNKTKKTPTQQKTNGKQKQHKSKRNPIAPIKQSMQLLDQLGKRMSKDINFFTKELEYRIKQQRTPEIKLNQCITLKVVRKLNHGGCIKKVLNIPTFKVYFLQQKPIHHADIKSSINKDLQKWNSCPPNSYQLKSIGLYWNTPEQFVSLLYQYCSSSSLEVVLSSVGNLPEQALAQKMVEVIHMISLFQKQGIKYPKIDSSEMLVSNSGNIRVRPNINLQVQQEKQRSSMVYQVTKWIQQSQNQKKLMPIKIGLMVFYMSLGSFIMQEEVQLIILKLYQNQVTNSKSSCCLLHKLEEFSNETPVFQSIKRTWSTYYQDFLCKCLSFSSDKRIKFEQMKNHPFITRQNQIQKISFMDLLQVTKIQAQISDTNSVEYGYQQQLNKVSEAIEMVLTNNSIKTNIQLPIKADDPTLEYLEEQIGLDKGTILQRINRTYAKFR